MRCFLTVFAQPAHPLVLFLDDLQWLDAATLDLLEDLLTKGDVRHLLVIGAYRDNEVTAAHPLIRMLDAIKSVAARVGEIYLAPLECEHVSQLIADSLYCDRERADPLARLVLPDELLTISFIPSQGEGADQAQPAGLKEVGGIAV